MAFITCLSIAFVISVPVSAAVIDIPSNSKLLGNYYNSHYPYANITVETNEFYLNGVWSEMKHDYIRSVVTKGYMNTDHFVAETDYYYYMNPSNNSNTSSKIYGRITIQRGVGQESGFLGKLKSTTIGSISDCPTNNSFTQEY